MTHALIIDDDPQNVEVLARLLAMNGVTYTAILDGSELESSLFGVEQIDVIFLDLELPRQNGYDVYADLRSRLGETPPIVACTVHSNEISVTRQMGFDGFISKPIHPGRFPSQLAHILNGEPVWDAS